MGEECLLLVLRDKETNKFLVRWVTHKESLLNAAYEDLGESTMASDNYRDRRVEVVQKLKEEGDEAAAEVLEALNAVKSKVAQAEEEEALEAA